MKKNLFFLFALICSMSLFTACSDDEEDNGWKEIPTEIPAENVKLDLNGGTLDGATASLKIETAETGVLTLENAVYGHATIPVNVTLKKVAEGSYDFEGTANIDGATKATAATDLGLTVTVKGNVTKAGKLTVEAKTSGWGTMAGVYSGDSLKATYSGTENNKYPVTVTMVSDTKATLLFNKVVNVANDFEVPVTLTKDGEGYKLEGTAEKEAGYNVHVSGTLVNAKLTVSITTSGYKTLEKFYFGSNAVINYNGIANNETLSLSLKNATDKNAVLNISGIFLNAVDLPNGVDVPVSLVKDANADSYTFDGSLSNKEFAFTATAKGSISVDRKMTVEITYKITSDLVGTWSPKMGEQGAIAIFNYAGPDVTLPKSLIDMLGNALPSNIPTTMNAATLNQVMNGVLAQYVPYLQSLTFKDNGYVDVAVKTIGSNATTNMEELLMYYVQGNQLYIFPDLGKLMGGGLLSAESAKSTKGWNPEDLINTGIPLTFDVSTGTIKLETGVVKGVVNFAAVLIEFGLLDSLLGDKAEEIKGIVSWANTTLQASETIEAGLVLTKK